jgi:hypothetical protein
MPFKKIFNSLMRQHFSTSAKLNQTNSSSGYFNNYTTAAKESQVLLIFEKRQNER